MTLSRQQPVLLCAAVRSAQNHQLVKTTMHRLIYKPVRHISKHQRHI